MVRYMHEFYQSALKSLYTLMYQWCISSAYSVFHQQLVFAVRLEIMGHFGENYTLNDLSIESFKKATGENSI